MSPSADSPATHPRPPWGLAWRLAIGQIFSWGLLYYSFTVVAEPMQEGTGWSRTFLNVGLSVGLLTWGLCTYPVGLWIQRHGARELMTVASLLGGAALMILALPSNPVRYISAWAMLGAAMAGTLYDPAFAVVTGAFRDNYRQGITLITLVGGLASTVFIPAAQLAIAVLGWNNALLVLGALQIVVCVPLHWVSIPKVSLAPSPVVPLSVRWSVWWKTFCRDITDPKFIALSLWFAAHSAAFTGLIFQVVPFLRALDVAGATIVAAISVMGPMQVVGRLFLSTQGSRFSSLRIGLFSMSLLVGPVLVLLFLPPTLFWLCLFAASLGLGNGMLTIVRGTAVAELFGRSRYAEINGALAAPGVLARAAAPLLFASIWSQTAEPRTVPLLAGVLLLAGIVAVLVTLRLLRRSPSARNPSSGDIGVSVAPDKLPT